MVLFPLCYQANLLPQPHVERNCIKLDCCFENEEEIITHAGPCTTSWKCAQLSNLHGLFCNGCRATKCQLLLKYVQNGTLCFVVQFEHSSLALQYILHFLQCLIGQEEYGITRCRSIPSSKKLTTACDATAVEMADAERLALFSPSSSSSRRPFSQREGDGNCPRSRDATTRRCTSSEKTRERTAGSHRDLRIEVCTNALVRRRES